MNTRVKAIVVTDFLLLMVSIVPFLLVHRQAVGYSPYNYLVVELLVLLLAFFIPSEKRNLFLLSPSFIAVSYLNINSFLGSWALKNGYSFDVMLIPYNNWEHLHLSMGFFNTINFFIINTYFFSRKLSFKRVPVVYDMRKVGKLTLSTIGLLLIIIFSFVGIDLSFFSGDPSDFYVIPKSLGAILLFVVLFRFYSLRFRLIGYAIIIVVFAVSSYEDKRDAIFLLLPILLLESTRYSFTLGVKKILLALVTTAFIGYLIMVMSILRGYGEYNPKGFWNATSYVDNYVESETFIASFMNNIEASYTFFHSHNAIEKVINDPRLLSFGSTIIKPLFIFVPRTYFPEKPDSIIELYTNSFSSEMRSLGYSAPISFQSEMFWNFWFFGIFAGVFFFFGFNCIYLNIIQMVKDHRIVNFIPLLYIYQQSLVLFRGSGLDQFTIDIILSFVIFGIVQLITRLLSSSKKRQASRNDFA